jgi:hypothetical protein
MMVKVEFTLGGPQAQRFKICSLVACSFFCCLALMSSDLLRLAAISSLFGRVLIFD